MNQLQEQLQKPVDKLSREPIATSQLITIATWLIAFAVQVGWVTNEQSDQTLVVFKQIAPVLAIVITAMVTYWQRQQVTPVKDPRDVDGKPLLPMTHDIEPA